MRYMQHKDSAAILIPAPNRASHDNSLSMVTPACLLPMPAHFRPFSTRGGCPLSPINIQFRPTTTPCVHLNPKKYLYQTTMKPTPQLETNDVPFRPSHPLRPSRDTSSSNSVEHWMGRQNFSPLVSCRVDGLLSASCLQPCKHYQLSYYVQAKPIALLPVIRGSIPVPSSASPLLRKTACSSRSKTIANDSLASAFTIPSPRSASA